MKTSRSYWVEFEIYGESFGFEFSDDLAIDDHRVREVNAKMWINDFIDTHFPGEKKVFRIIYIKPL